MLNQSFNVFDFLKIKYPDNAHRSALYYTPFALSILLSLVATYIGVSDSKGNYFTSERFSDLFTLLAILPGFFIAALSAIAAINSDAINKTINTASPPYLVKNEPDRADTYKQFLKRRVFLTMLFAYLSAISLLLVLFLTLVRFIYSLNTLGPLLALTSSNLTAIVFFFIASLITLFFVSQLIILTLLGVNYLGYKGLVED